jgi:hypothetical protein
MRRLELFRVPLMTLLWAVTAILCVSVPRLLAQQTLAIFDPQDRVERNAYRALFRQNLLYQRLADEAEASHNPKPYLKRLQPDRFQLSEDDYASLCRLSIAYQKEIDPVHRQVLQAISKFQARFPSGVVEPGADVEPPAELIALQQQEDAITLRYRDLLRNSMREEAFQRFKACLWSTFGKQELTQ